MRPKHIAALLLTASLCLAGGCGYILVEYVEETKPAASSGTSAPSGTLPVPEGGSVPADRIAEPLAPRTESAEAALDALYSADIRNAAVIAAMPESAEDTLLGNENDPFCDIYGKRNGMIEKKYGCSIFTRRVPDEGFDAALAASVKAGGSDDTYFADIMLLLPEHAGRLAVSGMLTDLRKLPFYTVMTDGPEGAGMYRAVNFFDISGATAGYSSRPVLYFSRDIAGEKGSAGLYSAALGQKFTFDYFTGFAKETLSSADGEAFALAVDAGDAANAFEFTGDIALIRSGLDFVSGGNGAYPALTEFYADGELSSTIISLSSLCEGSSREAGGNFALFEEGKVLFYIGKVSDITGGLATGKVPYGILPLPYLSDPSVYAPAGPGGAALCVPSNNARFDLTGIILSSLRAASGIWMGDEFANMCCGVYLRDNDSYYTLRELLAEPVYYDFSYFLGGSCAGLDEATYLAVRKCAADGTPLSETSGALAAKVNGNLKKAGLK